MKLVRRIASRSPRLICSNDAMPFQKPGDRLIPTSFSPARFGERFFHVAKTQRRSEEFHDENDKHCETCTCHLPNKTSGTYPCGSPGHEDDFGFLPPPLPEPAYSVHKRMLPASLTPLSSLAGRTYLVEALTEKTGEPYWALMEHFVCQSDPAFCGITTLMMVLNAMCIDPQIRWRGGWRFYGDEQVLLDRCCLSTDRIRRVGVTMEEFRLLGRCHGLSVDLKRPQDHGIKIHTLEAFRNDIIGVVGGSDRYAILVVAFSRNYLGQTGDGHFSPLAAYHAPTDSVLLLDVARFKYAPYWVSVESLYGSMEERDSATGRSRGWFLLRPPRKYDCKVGVHEDRRPAELVKEVGEEDACPVGRIKVDFCKTNLRKR